MDRLCLLRAPLSLTCFTDLDDLPVDAAALFDARMTICSAAWRWYRAVLAAGMPDAADARFVLCRAADGTAAALFPMRSVDRGRCFESLTTLYTCRYHPLVAGWIGHQLLSRTRSCTSRAIAAPGQPRASMRWRRTGAISGICIDAARSGRAGGAPVRSFRQLARAGAWPDLAGLPRRPARASCARRSGANCGGANAMPSATSSWSPEETGWNRGSRLLNRSIAEAGRSRSRFRTSMRR